MNNIKCYEDDTEEEILDTPFICPNCGKALGWYDYCECTDN